ncbi:MAG: response regulator [Lentisphaeraceae bacterium]|nr:response regulator [Lentisphaeraceae bacterium]
MKPINGRILILDDDVLVAVNYKDQLESHGFNCCLTHSIRDAYHFILNNSFDLVLCDHDLPDGKGLDLIKKIQAEKKDLPFIYFSAATPRVLKQAEENPLVKKVLTKPVSEDAIIKSVLEQNIVPPTNRTRFIGPIERKLILEINRDERTKEIKR